LELSNLFIIHYIKASLSQRYWVSYLNSIGTVHASKFYKIPYEHYNKLRVPPPKSLAPKMEQVDVYPTTAGSTADPQYRGKRSAQLPHFAPNRITISLSFPVNTFHSHQITYHHKRIESTNTNLTDHTHHNTFQAAQPFPFASESPPLQPWNHRCEVACAHQRSITWSPSLKLLHW
jgi:hypothetical protein